MFQATHFTSHTLQLENSRVYIFRFYHVFFSSRVYAQATQATGIMINWGKFGEIFTIINI